MASGTKSLALGPKSLLTSLERGRANGEGKGYEGDNREEERRGKEGSRIKEGKRNG